MNESCSRTWISLRWGTVFIYTALKFTMEPRACDCPRFSVLLPDFVILFIDRTRCQWGEVVWWTPVSFVTNQLKRPLAYSSWGAASTQGSFLSSMVASSGGIEKCAKRRWVYDDFKEHEVFFFFWLWGKIKDGVPIICMCMFSFFNQYTSLRSEIKQLNHQSYLNFAGLRIENIGTAEN